MSDDDREEHLIEYDDYPVEVVPDDNLISRGPLMTILTMSFGPFMAELSGAGYSIVDAFWVGKVCGENGLAAMALSAVLESLGRAFGMFLSVAASSQLASLRGRKNHTEMVRVFADLFRLCFICGILCPAILMPCVSPMLDFFGAGQEIKRMGTEYVFAALSGSVISCLNLFFCGFLQSEGRSMLYGMMQISAFLLNGLVFDPLFMIVFKMEMLGAGLATVCGEGVPMLVVAVWTFCGGFDMKVTLAELCKPPSKQTVEAIKTGFTQFVSHTCLYLTVFFSRKYMADCASASGQYSEMLAAFNVCGRMWLLPTSYAIAISIGLLPAASYAFAVSAYERVRKLVIWSFVLSFIWCTFIEVVVMFTRSYIGLLFGEDETFLYASARLLWISFLLCFTVGAQYVTQTLLQAIRCNTQAIILAFLTQFLPVPLFGTILYFTSETKDIFVVMYMFTLNDAFSLIVSVIFAIWPMWKLMSMERESISDNEQDVVESACLDAM